MDPDFLPRSRRIYPIFDIYGDGVNVCKQLKIAFLGATKSTPRLRCFCNQALTNNLLHMQIMDSDLTDMHVDGEGRRSNCTQERLCCVDELQ